MFNQCPVKGNGFTDNHLKFSYKYFQVLSGVDSSTHTQKNEFIRKKKTTSIASSFIFICIK